MKIALNSDFVTSRGSAEKYLKFISGAGFTHIHWCHQWNTDYLYSTYELQEFRKWFKQYGLTLLDIHGSAGMEKSWASTVEYQRKSGVELVENRIQMMVELEGCGALMMHPPRLRADMTDEERKSALQNVEAVCRTLDELMPVLDRYDQKIALENLFPDDYSVLETLLKRYPAKRLGLTYDSGHGNLEGCRGLDFIEEHKDRLEALHLHDNDGTSDQHKPPFTGNIDWERLARIIASSSYTNRPMSFELAMRNTPYYEEELKADQKEDHIREFLADAYKRCEKFSNMVDSRR